MNNVNTVLAGIAAGVLCAAFAPAAAPLPLLQTIPLPGVEGRIDHLAHDGPHNRLFVAALGNNSVEVVDLAAGKVVSSLKSFAEPQGVLYVEESHRLYVANGGDGTVRVVDGDSLKEITKIFVGEDADNLRYDANAKQIYVGYGGGAIGVIDPSTNSVLYSIPLHGHPESFQLEEKGTQIFVNVPGAHEIAIVDRATRKQIGKWSLGLVAANFPLALDELGHRVVVATRLPARILVFDTETGKGVAKLDLHGDCDDVFRDAARQMIYASCGEGYIDTFKEGSADQFSKASATKTAAKARTSLLVSDKLFLAVPRHNGRPARIEVYSAGEP